ncbi:MAG: hypothetical protein KGJ89_03005 [Patescibacteria group bacterium]|nr:hypothetical protein [Patescibacteria group bacterium]MDE2015481.1 hypothetical protein [Patescibacteria group bacterium]MDE2226903.1 hypothetical protein [Patescibacteria group bacterium]
MKRPFFVIIAVSVFSVLALAQFPIKTKNNFSTISWEAYTRRLLSELFPGDPLVESVRISIYEDKEPYARFFTPYEIVISKGQILALADNGYGEEEYAGELAHEFGHLKLKHVPTAKFTGILSKPLEDFELLEKQEVEADDFAVSTFLGEGRDPCAVAKFLELESRLKHWSENTDNPYIKIHLRRLARLEKFCNPNSLRITSFLNVEIPVPEKFGKLVSSHIDLMFREGYFMSFSDNDFSHGHLLLKADRKESYNSLDELSQDIALVVYHTDESGVRWGGQGQLSPLRRKQRSLAGYLDGSIRPAIGAIDLRYRKQLQHYECCGTVHDIDIINSNPILYGKYIDNTLVKLKGGEAFLINQFSVRPIKTGRFHLGNEAYEIYFILSEKPKIQIPLN